MIVFDLGGVVVRIVRNWKEACAAAGLPFHEAAAAPERVALRRPLTLLHEVGALACDDYYARIAATLDGLYSPQEVATLHQSWITGEYEGVGAVIEALHAAGVETGVLSNTNATHWRQLVSGTHGEARFPTPGMVRHPHASHLLQLAKPSAAIYRAFEAATGFAASDIAFFDDLPDNVVGARACGWRAHRIDPQGNTDVQMRTQLAAWGLRLD